MGIKKVEELGKEIRSLKDRSLPFAGQFRNINGSRYYGKILNIDYNVNEMRLRYLVPLHAARQRKGRGEKNCGRYGHGRWP